MPFWSTNFGENTDLKDPKRNFRFSVEFTGIQAAQGGATLWYAKSIAKPSFTISTSEHVYLNHKFFYPGAVTWNDITVNLVDPADPDITATLSDIVIQSGYSPPTDATAQNMNSMSKAKAAGALGTVVIKQLDSNGSAIETWTLWNAFIMDIKYGDGLAYGNDDLTEIAVQLKYDWARVDTKVASSAIVGGGNSFFNV